MVRVLVTLFTCCTNFLRPGIGPVAAVIADSRLSLKLTTSFDEGRLEVGIVPALPLTVSEWH